MKNNIPSHTFHLTGKKALICGGTGGLGGAIAKQFLQSGADTAVCGRSPEKAVWLEDEARQAGQTLLALPCDILDPTQVQQMLADIAQAFGRIDILVNAVGINQLLPAEDYDEDSFSQVMDLNIKGIHTVTRAVGQRFMIPNRYGRIVNLSSVKGTLGAKQDYLAYCTSKGAVNMYTKQLACEWGKYQITCNAIAPTFVRTPINAFQLDDPVFFKNLTERIPLGRIGQEADVAAAALFLCSDAAAFISGQILGVDGGLTALQ